MVFTGTCTVTPSLLGTRRNKLTENINDARSSKEEE
jgi:hypothetical protein